MTYSSGNARPRLRSTVLAAVSTAAMVAGLAVTAVPASAADEAVVDISEQRQVIRGFGGMSHEAWIGDLTTEQRDTAFDNGADDLGMTILRIPVPESRADFPRNLATAQAASQKGALVFASPWNPPAEFTENFAMEPPAVGSKYEAESGGLVGAQVANAQPGFEGAGYVEFVESAGASVQFNGITLGSTGVKNLAFRYALASGSRTMDLYLDGVLALEDVVFDATGSASSWARKHVQLTMSSGVHSVRLVTTGGGGPSLDNVQVSAYVEPGQAKRLRYDRYADYAAYLEEYVDYMRDNGVDLYAISIQNEPDYAHEWTWWTPDEIVRFLRDHADVISTRVMAPESFQYKKNMSDPILNDPGALANTDIIGAHLYGTALADFPYPLFEQKGEGKELWMTEVYVPNSTANSANLWPEALGVAEHIHHSMADAQFQAYVWWYLRRSYGPMLEDGSISKRGYSMAHFSKFVRPGDVRVEATKSPQAGVLLSAYLRADGSVAIVAVNSNSAAVEQAVSVGGVQLESVSAWTTDASRNLAPVDQPAPDGSSFTATLAAASVTTFVVEPGDVGDSGIPIRATVQEGAEGALALHIADTGDGVDLGETSASGNLLRAQGELPIVTVVDSRNEEQAAGGGWTVTGHSSTFVGARTYSGAHLGWTPRFSGEPTGAALGQPIATALAGGYGLEGPQVLAQAGADTRAGATKLTAGLALELPVDAPAGQYRARLAISLFPVD
jgi:glucuronoarabinoxylan endo-1,4-beta-xylanase